MADVTLECGPNLECVRRHDNKSSPLSQHREHIHFACLILSSPLPIVCVFSWGFSVSLSNNEY